MTSATLDYTAPIALQQVEQTAAAVQARGVQVKIVNTGEEALERIQQLIPAQSTIMTGGSKTLQQIGLEALLMSKNHPWVNIKDEMLAEKDPVKQMALRRKSALADYFLGSVQAISQTGEIVLASAGGSQLPAYAFSSPNVIWVAGVHKITPTLDEAIRRVREYALPREDERMKSLGMAGSFIGKLLIFEREAAMLGRNIHLILVNETVGV